MSWSEDVGKKISIEFKGYESDEWLLANEENRFVIFPIRHEEMWRFYKLQITCFWTPEEIDLYNDLNDFNSLKPEEQHFIKFVLAFFASSDGIVIENIALKFVKDVKVSEARAFYAFQMAMENIHSEVYSILIDEYIKDKEEKNKLLNAISTVPAVQRKAEWALKWINDDISFAERLVAFCAVEGILFSASFCAIFWLKKRGLLPGLSFSNELISRDEGIHTEFGCFLYNQLTHRLPEFVVHHIISEAVTVEESFIVDALPSGLVGMNADLMTKYVKFVANRICQTLGYTSLYSVTNPFDFMDLISVPGKTNFFERRVAEYQRSGIAGDVTEREFATNADF